MSRLGSPIWTVSLFAATFTLAAPGCDPAASEDDADEVTQPRFTPPFDPTPKEAAPAPKTCGCGPIDEPVCGDDGKTYSNSCQAECGAVEVAHDGPCVPVQCASDDTCAFDEFCDFGAACGGAGVCAPQPDFCVRKKDPVCGCDGETYKNECLAHAEGVSVAAEGKCPDQCVCTQEYAPVCGVDGETYGNACSAGCAEVEVDYVGECVDGCDSNADCGTGRYCQRDANCGGTGTCADQPQLCTQIYDPVCGCDGDTYGNSCEAAAQGVSVEGDGACEGMDFE